MKGIIKERRTAYFAIFPPIFSTFQQTFNIVFNKKASFPQKSAVLRANTLYWKKYGYCWKLKFSTSAAYAQRRAFLEMRLKYFLAVYARKWTDSLTPKKFNCGGGHICPKVKTPYGQKRGGGIWRRTGGKSPRAAPRFCGRLSEKNKRGKNPAPESVGGAKNGFVMRFFALQPFL